MTAFAVLFSMKNIRIRLLTTHLVCYREVRLQRLRKIEIIVFFDDNPR